MNKNLWLFLPATMFLLPVYSQKQPIKLPDGKTLSPQTIDKMVVHLMTAAEVPGLCLGIIADNKPVYVKAYGYKNKAMGKHNDTATSFYAASLSKPLFAFLVMQLVDEGKLNLDKPLYTYLPQSLLEYAAYKDLAGDDRWKLITPRHCLDHTTGFPNWRELNPHNNRKLEIFFMPGERYAYSGEGLYLLQMVVEHITGKRLEEIAQQRIFRPLGMRRTSFVWQPSFESNYALGHDMNTDTLTKDKHTSANAAGSMETTITDYSRFLSAVMVGMGITSQSKQEMLSPQININSVHQFPSLNHDTTTENKSIQLAYGLGWGLFNSKYGKAFFKEGHGEGWTHYMIGFPERGYAVIIMTNSANGESMFKELVEDLTDVTLPWKWEAYTPYRPTVQLPVEILQQYTGQYDGKIKAMVTLVKGQLKVESETEGLRKTNLYAISQDHFFLKVMDTELHFVKSSDGKVEKVILSDEGEHYELKKVK